VDTAEYGGTETGTELDDLNITPTS